MAGAIASYSPIIAHSGRSVYVFRYETTRGLICSIRTPRLVSAAASSFVASFAVLLFEPHTTIPPSSKATAAAKNPRSDRITPMSIAVKTTAPPATAIRAARMNLGQFSILAASSSVSSRGGRSPRGDPHLLGFLDWPKPCRSSDTAGVAVCSPNDPCSNPIRECVLPDQFGKPVV